MTSSPVSQQQTQLAMQKHRGSTMKMQRLQRQQQRLRDAATKTCHLFLTGRMTEAVAIPAARLPLLSPEMEGISRLARMLK